MVSGVTVVENNLDFVGDQKLGGNVLSFDNVLFILKMDTFLFRYFISKSL